MEHTNPEVKQPEPEMTEFEASVPVRHSHAKIAKENESKKTIIFVSLFIIALVAIFAFFGQNLLVTFAILLGQTNRKDVASNIQPTPIFVPAPLLDPIPKATNSAMLIIRGVVSAGVSAQVRLYLNDKVTETTQPAPNDQFMFDPIQLQEGANEIKAITVINGEKSKYSNILKTIYSKDAPAITIFSPADGDHISGDSTLIVKGQTTPGASVQVNGFVAIVKEDGSFSQALHLQNSENIITITAKNAAGNATEKTIKITFSP